MMLSLATAASLSLVALVNAQQVLNVQKPAQPQFASGNYASPEVTLIPLQSLSVNLKDGQRNRDLIQSYFANASGKHVILPETPASASAAFWPVEGSISMDNLKDARIEIRGNILYSANFSTYLGANNQYGDMFRCGSCARIEIISTNGATIDGAGFLWWQQEILQAIGINVKLWSDRPKLMSFLNGQDIYFGGLTLLNSPSFHLNLEQVSRVWVDRLTAKADTTSSSPIYGNAIQQQLLQKYFPNESSALSSWRDIFSKFNGIQDMHKLWEMKNKMAGLKWYQWPQAFISDVEIITKMGWNMFVSVAEGMFKEFESYAEYEFALTVSNIMDKLPIYQLNTDGIDPSGDNILITDFVYTGGDDAVAVKPMGLPSCTTNVVVDGAVINWSTGLALGTVPSHDRCLQLVQFNNVTLQNPYKGIYIKSNYGNQQSIVRNITYSNIQINNAVWWPIDLAPNQQAQPGSKGGQGCSFLYPLSGFTCPVNPTAVVQDVLLKNVVVHQSLWPYDGMVLGAAGNFTDIIWQGVSVTGGIGSREILVKNGLQSLGLSVQGAAISYV